MRVALLASEVDPFAKTGGLADVAGALPRALAQLGHEVRILLPLYRQVDRARWTLRSTGTRVRVPVGATTHDGQVWETTLPRSAVPVTFIECAPLFDRDGLYQQGGQDHPDNLERFSMFSQAALRALAAMGWKPQVVHCHDWQAALACAHLAHGAIGRESPFTSVGTVFTIHNLAYQGLFPREAWALTQLPEQLFGMEGLEYYGQINCLKGGLVSAHLLTTVSPTYAREIQTQEFGCGLEGVLRVRQRDLVGILNGIDPEEWNPQTDPHLPAHYTADELAGKSLCKLALQKSQQLPERHHLVIGMIQRLAEQKGIDLLTQAMEELMRLPVQLVLLGTGDPVYHQKLEQLAAQHPEQLAVQLAFDNALAHQIEAGADAFLMPSRFEPCGLNQMYSMRYGTVPVVRRVGGLADTVVDVTSSTLAKKTATGFVFEEHSPRALVEAVRRAATAFQDHALWTQLVATGMRQDFSWTASARAYAQVYERALAKAARPHGSRSKAPV